MMKFETAYGPTDHEHLTCSYCDQEIGLDERICGYCHEYKGVMTVEFWEAYLGLSFDCACVSDPYDTMALCGCGAVATRFYPGPMCNTCHKEWSE